MQIGIDGQVNYDWLTKLVSFPALLLALCFQFKVKLLVIVSYLWAKQNETSPLFLWMFARSGFFFLPGFATTDIFFYLFCTNQIQMPCPLLFKWQAGNTFTLSTGYAEALRLNPSRVWSKQKFYTCTKTEYFIYPANPWIPFSFNIFRERQFSMYIMFSHSAGGPFRLYAHLV